VVGFVLVVVVWWLFDVRRWGLGWEFVDVVVVVAVVWIAKVLLA